MGLSFHVPLPGPFTYSKRLGGKRSGGGLLVTILAWTIALPIMLIVWGVQVTIYLVRKRKAAQQYAPQQQQYPYYPTGRYPQQQQYPQQYYRQ